MTTSLLAAAALLAALVVPPPPAPQVGRTGTAVAPDHDPNRGLEVLDRRPVKRASRSAPRRPRPAGPARPPRPDLLWRIALCESGGNPRAVSASGTFRGAFQFSTATWRGVGGVGDPAAAPLTEQRARAERLYALRGIAPWPVCGRRALAGAS